MYAIDFEYDGQYLSDYGLIICNFDYSNGTATADAGSKLSFEKVSRNGGKKFSLINATYDECISTEFDICKNPDLYDYDERQISNDEYRDLMRWLNRREFLKFQVFDEDDKERDGEIRALNLTPFLTSFFVALRSTPKAVKNIIYLTS